MIRPLSIKKFIAKIAVLALVVAQVSVTSIMPAYANPGGVGSDLGLWLKANVGTNTTTHGQPVSAWSDQGSGGNNASQGTANLQPTYVDSDNGINFNPSLDFDGADKISGAAGGYSASYYIVFTPDDIVNSGLGDPGKTGPVVLGMDCSDCGSNWGSIGLGSVTDAFTDEVITAISGSATEWRFAQSGTMSYPAGTVMQVAVRNDNTPGSEEGFLYMGGKRIDTVNSGGPFRNATNTAYNIGDQNPNTAYPGIPSPFDGKIAEVITYSSMTTLAEHQRIMSYLAIKYGFTLDQTDAVTDYIDSGGYVLWDASEQGVYNNDIAGVGRDNSSALNQPKSKSLESDGIVIIEDTSGTVDGQFLIWGNNDGDFASWTTTEAPTGYSRIAREWRVDELRGDTENVQISVANSDLPAGINGNLFLFVDSDGDFSAGASPVGMTDNSGTWEYTINFSDNDYFTFGYDANANPPTGSFNSAVQKTDGSGDVDVSIEVDDDDDWDTRARIEYETDSDGACNGPWASATLIGPATADFDDSGGVPDVNNGTTYQVGSGATTRIITSSGSNTVAFDWDANTNLPTANGTQCIRLTANDDAGSQVTPDTQTVNVDVVAPSAPSVTSVTTDSGTSGTDEITNDNTLVFNGTSEANATIEVFIDGGSIGTVAANGVGVWSYDHSGTTLSDATYALSATATDAGGNESPSSGALSVIVDTVAPGAPTVTSPTDSGNVSNPTTVSVTCNEAGEIISISNSSLVTNPTTDTCVGAGSRDVAITWDAGANGTVQDISVTLTDVAGNTSGATTVTGLNVDFGDPTVTTIARQNPLTETTSSDSLVFRVTFSEDVQNVDTADFALTVSGTSGSVDSIAVVSAGIYDVTVDSVTGDGTLNLDIDGGNNIQDLASNAYDGNIGSEEEYIIDNTGFNVTINQEASQADPTNTSPVLFTVVFSEAINEVTFIDSDITFGGTATTGTVTITEVAPNDDTTFEVSTEVTASGTVIASLADGVVENSIANTNTASASTDNTVTFDNTAPSSPATPDLIDSSDTGASNSDEITSDNTPTFAGSGGVSGDTITIYSDAASVGSGIVAGDGTWSVTTSVIADGTVDITATYTDPLSNESAASTALPVTIDTAVPTAPVVASIDQDTGASNSDGITNDSTLIFIGTAEVDASVEVFIDAGSIGTTSADGSGDWSYDHTAITLPDAAYALTAVATDAAGNASVTSATFNVTVSVSAPLPPAVTSVTTDTGTSGSDQITFDNTLVFTGTSEINNSVEVFIDGGSIGTTSADGSGDWSYDHTGVTLPDATYAITAIATNLVGNPSSESTALNVTVDTVAPGAPTVDDPNDSDNVPSPTTVTIACNEVGEIISIANANITTNPTTDTCIGAGDRDVNIIWDAGADGTTQNINVTLTDVAGNTSGVTTVSDLNVDLSATTITSIVRQDPAITATSADAVTFRVTFNEPVQNVDISDFGLTEGGTVSASRDNVTSVSSSVYDVDIDPVSGDGTLNLDVSGSNNIQDLAGNSYDGNVGSEEEYIIDNTDFDVTINQAATQPDPTDISPVLFTAVFSEAIDASAFVSGDVTVGGTAGTGAITITETVPGTTYEISVVGTSDGTITASLAEGVVLNAAGNINNASTGTDNSVGFDNTPPGVPPTPDLIDESDTGSSQTDNITSDNTPTFTGTGGEPGDIVIVYWEDTPLGTSSVESDGSWSFTAPAMLDGNKRITATYTDIFDNESDPSFALLMTIDTTTVTPFITGALEDAGAVYNNVTKDPTLIFNGTAEANSTVQIFIRNIFTGEAVTNDEGVWAYDNAAMPLHSAIHEVYAIATDVAGNVNGQSEIYSVTVDTTPPPTTGGGGRPTTGGGGGGGGGGGRIIISGGGGGGGIGPVPLPSIIKKRKTTTSTGVVEKKIEPSEEKVLHSAAPPFDSFVDIKKHWSEAYVEEIHRRDIVSGKTETHFEPNKPITRAELIKIAVNTFDYDVPKRVSKRPSDDVSIAEWYAPYIATARENGIIYGMEDRFRPEEPATRAFAATILTKASDYNDVGEHFKKNYLDQGNWKYAGFKDVPIDEWYAPSVAYLKDKGVVSGYKDGTFGSSKSITRAEISKIVVEMNDWKVNRSVSSGESEKTGIAKIRESQNVSPSNTTNSTCPFFDTKTHWAKSYIEEMCKEGVVNGKSKFRFAPKSNITRAEVIKIAMNAFGYDVPTAVTKNPSRDVEADKWYAPYITAAYQNKIVYGMEDRFEPNKPATRAFAATVLTKAARFNDVQENFKDNYKSKKGWRYAGFSDVSIDGWYAPYVAYLKDKGIISGYKDGTFGVDKPITRAEIAKIAAMLMDL